MKKSRYVASGIFFAATGLSLPLAAEAADSALPAPDGVIVTSGPDGVAVEWEDTSNAGGFDVYVNGQYTDTVLDARFDDPNGAPNTVYQIVAFDHNKSNHSPKSQQAVGEDATDNETSVQPADTNDRINPRVTQEGDETVTRYPDGNGGFTEVRADRDGNILMESIMVANIDGNGTSELSVFIPSRNTTTTYVAGGKGSEMVTTTVYHDTNTTIVETLTEYGETVEEVTTQDGTITTVYDVDFELISITSADGVLYTGLDLEIIEGTEYRMWEFKEAFVATRPSHRQLKVLHAVYQIDHPVADPDTTDERTFGQRVADEWAGGDNVDGEFGGLSSPSSSSAAHSSSGDSDSSSGSSWSGSSSDRSDDGQHSSSGGSSAQDAADEYAGGNNEGGEFG